MAVGTIAAALEVPIDEVALDRAIAATAPYPRRPERERVNEDFASRLNEFALRDVFRTASPAGTSGKSISHAVPASGQNRSEA